MATQSSSKKGRPARTYKLQQEQDAAAVAAQTDPTRLTRQETHMHQADLLTPDEAEEELPPPVYGDVYGEIRNEEDGLGTSAYVNDDGRVNIRVNQFNRRLSQIFTPALRQEVQSVQESRPPTPTYIPASLGGAEGVPPPPPLNIVIQVVGSRGDVQPFVALGKVLKGTYGHRVRLATHPNFKDFVQENGLEFFSISGDPSRLMAFMVQNPSLMPGFRSLLSGDIGQRRKDVAEYIQGCWRSCYEAGDGMGLRATDDDLSEPAENDPSSEPASRPFVADCIIANPPSFAHIHCAEKLGIPLHIMFTMPYSPTQAFPHPLANIQSSNADPQLTNYISYIIIEVLSWQGLGDIINRFRAKCLGLDPISQIWAPGMLQRLKVPHTYCWSPALIPKPKDWGPHISISGFYFLSLASKYTPTPDLRAFLDAGPPPIYIGFGSIVLDDPDMMTELIFEVARKTGQRILLSKGWGGMGVGGLSIPDNVFMLGNVPHDWLFKHVSCVVHHGGAGTTAAGITAGRPTVIVPFFGDQPFWGAMVARAGAGPDPIPYKQLTADKLVNAIDFCLKPESRERAKEFASKIAAERGSDMGAQSFHQHLEADRLRCTLAPSRSAAWRVKRTRVRLSAFAACTLANANLLDFRDLKLFRPQEYHTDEGPWDPISGGAAACYRAFSGMAMGLAEVPSETLKALHVPIGSSRQQSQKSVPTIIKESETSHMRGGSAPPTSPEQSQTSLNEQENLSRARSHPSLSDVSSFTSNVGSSSISDALQGQWGPKQDDVSRNRVRSRAESGFGKDRDMLRRTGAHTSKGFGRFVTAFVQIPMEVSVGLTKGFHNMPKLWGDDTVRAQEQVTDFKSGAIAAGKEFGYGWYDGVTGLVTQPWNGAQKDGAGGFVKGIGKGVAGFATKPFAGFSGILGHTMKGVQKEVQRIFGGKVQNYIVASRVAQGYEEWLQSSDAEKQDVIVRWKLIQKHLKGKSNPDETVQGVLDAQQKKNLEDTVGRQNREYTSSSAQSAGADARPLDLESAMLAMGGSQSSQESLDAAEMEQTIRLSVQETSRKDIEEEAVQENATQLQRQQQEAVEQQADQENLRQAIAASEIEAQRHASEALEFKKQLEHVMAQSVLDQRQSSSNREEEEY
ncbi:Sterol 3-beta-glucosyltransferase UGT80B1 [Exophiala dermatitidis]